MEKIDLASFGPRFFVRVATSKKTGNLYACLMVDLGYANKMLSFDTNLCAELLRMSVFDLMDSAPGTDFPV